MKWYEYLVLETRIINDAETLTRVLDSYGRKGWELVSATDDKLYLKRLITDVI